MYVAYVFVSSQIYVQNVCCMLNYLLPYSLPYLRPTTQSVSTILTL